MTASAAYRVEHRTCYRYAAPVSTSQHLFYLQPRDHARQRLRRHELAIEPAPARISRRTDYFGNVVGYFALVEPHTRLSMHAASEVEVTARAALPQPGESPPWELARDAAVYRKDQGAVTDDAGQFVYASPYVPCDPELADYARPSFAAGRPLLESALDLTHRIHADFHFDPSATDVATPIRRVLAERRGVCQDFAHIELACLRSLGLAARYVSGYLVTDPPPGQARLIGADASHAWIALHCPVHGWVDMDPTNDVMPDARHVTLAWGRDYGDVSPVRGLVLGGARHTLDIGVSVLPLQEPLPERVPT